MAKSKLTGALVLVWADAHMARTGRWPTAGSGPVRGAPGETWLALDRALLRGLRGLPGGDTLARLLHRERGVPVRRGRPPSAAAAARRRRAVRLRRRGLSLSAIGARLGVSPQAVQQMLQRAGRETAGR
jgi:hypothetical protein